MTLFQIHHFMKTLFTISILFLFVFANAQVKIGDNPNTINSNSLLELESTTKGFLPARVTLVSLDNVAPLTGTVPAGMLVYNTGTAVPSGYYFWDGSKWATLSQSNMVAKTANATLTKAETFVLGSNDIKLTLPVVTAAENGLAITVKNFGVHTDQVVVVGSGGATIDGIDSSTLYRWIGRTFVAYNGNWINKEKESKTNNVFEVSPIGSWTTITEALEFLDMHMRGPSVIRLSDETFLLNATQVIDLAFPLTIEGVSYSTTTIAADPALAGLPMFRCLTETYFKKIAFDGAGVTGEDAIQLEGAGEYFEIKDCSFEGFNRTIVLETNVELWLFETDITDAAVAGVEFAAGANKFAQLTASECDFTNCEIGINLKSSDSATSNIVNCTFYNTGSQVGINYVPGVGNYYRFVSMFITNNAWNNIGSFMSGFDFSRTDGRDAKAHIQNNAGDGDKNPSCHINVLNSATTTTLTTLNLWYKAAWDYTKATFTTTKWTVTNATGAGNVNRIAYQPTNRKGGWFIISGNLSCNQVNRTISVAIVKNGVSTTRFGETTIRTSSVATPTLFSTVVYFADIGPTDYFEIYASTLNSGDLVTFQDVQWFADTK